MRAKRAIGVFAKNAKTFARRAQILRETKGVSLRMTDTSSERLKTRRFGPGVAQRRRLAEG